MGTEVLRPQDCLIGRIRDHHPVVFHRRKSNYGNANTSYVSNSRSTRKPAVRPDKQEQRRRFVMSQSEPSVSKRSSSSDDSKLEKRSLSMEKVTILRRGESMDSKLKSEALRKEDDAQVLLGTQRLGSVLGTVPIQIRILDPMSPPMNGKCDVYAGSAFAVSPAPSSLPLPSFSKKKCVYTLVDDSATRDLRRLLKLSL